MFPGQHMWLQSKLSLSPLWGDSCGFLQQDTWCWKAESTFQNHVILRPCDTHCAGLMWGLRKEPSTRGTQSPLPFIQIHRAWVTNMAGRQWACIQGPSSSRYTHCGADHSLLRSTSPCHQRAEKGKRGDPHTQVRAHPRKDDSQKTATEDPPLQKHFSGEAGRKAYQCLCMERIC